MGAGTYPDGAPDLSLLLDDNSTQNQKLRRVAQINAEQPGRIRVLSEDEFCGFAGQPSVADRRTQHYGVRDILAMYPALRVDHLRYLEKWGFIKPAFRNNADTFFGFSDLTTLRRLCDELQQGASFRAALRDLQASRTGQLAFDFRLDAQPARIIELKPRIANGADAQGTLADAGAIGDLSTAERYFLMGPLLDDGSSHHLDEAAQAYRRRSRTIPICRRPHQSGQHPLLARRARRGPGALRARDRAGSNLLRSPLQSREHPSRSRAIRRSRVRLSPGAVAESVPTRTRISTWRLRWRRWAAPSTRGRTGAPTNALRRKGSGWNGQTILRRIALIRSGDRH